jgi:hypothetical protein
LVARIDRWLLGLIVGCSDGSLVARMDRWLLGWIVRCSDGSLVARMDRWLLEEDCLRWCYSRCSVVGGNIGVAEVVVGLLVCVAMMVGCYDRWLL